MGHATCIGNEIVDAVPTHNVFSICSGTLETGVAGEICMKDVDVGTTLQLCRVRHLLLRRGFIADETDDYIVRVFRQVP